MRGRIRIAALVLAAGGAASPATAQEEGWNSGRALELIRRAEERRARPVVDSLLRSYQSHASGRVYFYLDRRASGHRTLVKTDQIALDVFWAAPDSFKQRIVGLRDESRLPNRMRYHLDHLTVVQNEFGNRIRLGDGDEVRDVPHPVAPGSTALYDYRLADSLTIRLPGSPEPVRAYEIQVRPKRSDDVAVVGSVYIDRGTADIVRMSFTFTPQSYVDPRLDYISISLDNSLWEGKYWLPHEQSVEIRRQVPELDFIAGAVILGRFRISNYQLNIEHPANTFQGFRVEAAPLRLREAYPFETGLYDDLESEGLAPPPEMAELRAEAARLLGISTVTGLPSLRISIGGASDIFRYDRAEGAVLNAGLSWSPGTLLRAEVSGGFASGAEHGLARAGFTAGLPAGPTLGVEGYLNDAGDLGVRPGEAGVINSIASLGWADDYRDTFYRSGFALHGSIPIGETWDLGGRLRAERHRTATLSRTTAPFDAGAAFRPVRSIDEGWLYGVDIGLERLEPTGEETGWGGRAGLDAGVFDGGAYLRPTADVAWRASTTDLRTHFGARAAAGVAFSLSGDTDLAAQQHFALGGRNTVPGYGYRSFAGDAFGMLDAEVAHDVAWPWLRLRALGAVGFAANLADLPDAADPDRRFSPSLDWGTTTSDGLRPSLGLGAGILWDVLRLEVHRGLRGGEWQVLLTVDRSLWGLL